MKARCWLLIGLLFLVSSACATAPTGPPQTPTVDVSGVWEGSWYSSYGGGQVSLTLQQTGAKVTGEITLTKSQTFQGGPVEGTVAGNLFTFTSSGPFRAELTVKSDEMSGPFVYTLSNTMSLRRKK